MNLTELERDAVTELLNVAIGRAAAALSQLVEDEVRLSFPSVDFLTPAEAVLRLEEECRMGESVAVRQGFSGRIQGHILLIFPEARSLDLVRSMLGHEVPLDTLTELEQEALLEVGNVVLNACLASLADDLGMSLGNTLPTFVRGCPTPILTAGSEGDHELILFVHVDFMLIQRRISGYLAFVMDIASANTFVQAVDAHIRAKLEA